VDELEMSIGIPSTQHMCCHTQNMSAKPKVTNMIHQQPDGKKLSLYSISDTVIVAVRKLYLGQCRTAWSCWVGQTLRESALPSLASAGVDRRWVQGWARTEGGCLPSQRLLPAVQLTQSQSLNLQQMHAVNYAFFFLKILFMIRWG